MLCCFSLFVVAVVMLIAFLIAHNSNVIVYLFMTKHMCNVLFDNRVVLCYILDLITDTASVRLS